MLSNFSIPPKRYLNRQSLPPVGVTKRKRPPPSKSFWGFSAGLIVLTLVSVSGAILLGRGFPSLLGVSPLVAGANTPTHTPKPFGFHYTNMNIIGQQKKKKALFLRLSRAVSDDTGFDFGGGGGS